jgi:serine/threonine-protein kinase
MKVCPECARSYSDDAVVCAFDGSPLSAGSTGAWESRQRGAEPIVGDVLGQYRILGKLAQGGMGVIYKAQHVRLGRHVALKVLKSDLVRRSEVVQRFFAEARAVNEIGHPSIVDIIDFVEVGDVDPPLVYMVMELLTGQDLGRRIREKGPLDPLLAAAIADRIADALAATHRVKILHRDLKPENVYLLESEGELRVKLLDFGVAKAFGERKRQDMTDPGSAVGTPAYMAPEQVLELELDERTDIYALGLLLYEMLTGSVPFHATSYGEVLIKQVKERPEAIRKRRTTGTSVPPALERIVMTCLEKEPARRFQNMGQVRGALAAAVDLDRPVTSAPSSAASFPSAPRAGGRPLLVVAGALFAAAITVGIWLLVSPAEPRAGARSADRDALPSAATRIDRGARAPVAAALDAGAEEDREGHPEVAKRPGKRRPVVKGGEKVGEKAPQDPRPGTKSRESTVDPFAL